MEAARFLVVDLIVVSELEPWEAEADLGLLGGDLSSSDSSALYLLMLSRVASLCLSRCLSMASMSVTSCQPGL